jgi:hypothetical protein
MQQPVAFMNGIPMYLLPTPQTADNAISISACYVCSATFRHVARQQYRAVSRKREAATIRCRPDVRKYCRPVYPALTPILIAASLNDQCNFSCDHSHLRRTERLQSLRLLFFLALLFSSLFSLFSFSSPKSYREA